MHRVASIARYAQRTPQCAGQSSRALVGVHRAYPSIPSCRWNIRCVAAGSTSTIVASETSLVTWGPSPTHGELGYGEDIKSSTKPKLVDSLEGCTIIDVAAGASASLILVSTAGLALPDSIATYTPPIKVLTPLADAAAATSAIAAADASAAAGGAGKKRGRPAGGASAATSKATGKAGAAKSGAAAKRRG
ncbi:hypothetical protein EON67_09570 [archaeon]|nr:MAG: hypothetical protein EON67_09570 [archaeon]